MTLRQADNSEPNKQHKQYEHKHHQHTPISIQEHTPMSTPIMAHMSRRDMHSDTLYRPRQTHARTLTTWRAWDAAGP